MLLKGGALQTRSGTWRPGRLAFRKAAGGRLDVDAGVKLLHARNASICARHRRDERPCLVVMKCAW